MPGTVVTTSARSGPSTPLANSSGQLFAVGLSERGPTNAAVLVSGMADFTRIFGNRQAYGYLWDVINTFFAEGGSQAYIARVVGGTATIGTLVLKDKGASGGASTLTITPTSAGAWSGNLSVVVVAGTITGTYRIQLLLSGVIVQDFNNLVTPADAVAAFQGSDYVTVVDMGSVTVAPANQPTTGTFAVTAGTDDRTDVVAANYLTALGLFTKDLGDGAVAIPGMSSAVHVGLLAHAKAFNRIALLSLLYNSAITDLTAASGAITVNGEFGGLFAPWVQVSDGAGGSINVSPEGFVAAARNKAITQTGNWRAPAGIISTASTLTGLTAYYTDDQGNALDDGNVSVIRKIANSLRLYGWRSLSQDSNNYMFLSARDVMNRVSVEAANRLEKYVFGVIDQKGQLLSSINAECVGIVAPMASAGGLYPLVDPTGKQVDPGYNVVTDSSVNTPSTLSQNTVHASIGLRLSPTGAWIYVTVTKVGLLSGL